MQERHDQTDLDCQPPTTEAFLDEVLAGLSSPVKSLPSKYLYDQPGSALFDQICEQPEYYLTRTEASIMRESASEIADAIGKDAVIVELGSGSSTKTRILLDALDSQSAYLPVDISEEHLLEAAEGIKCEYPDLKVEPVVADFTHAFTIPSRYAGSNTHIFFPGSTIGNFTNEEAIELLTCARTLQTTDGAPCSPGLIIGFDLVKETHTLEAAYNDAAGVSAEFSLNILHRMNRELDANFDVACFEHYAFFNASESRIEIFVRSLAEQTVTIAGQDFEFGDGEKIRTEYSHKYTLERFSELALQAGFEPSKTWLDENKLFAIMQLRSTEQ